MATLAVAMLRLSDLARLLHNPTLPRNKVLETFAYSSAPAMIKKLCDPGIEESLFYLFSGVYLDETNLSCLAQGPVSYAKTSLPHALVLDLPGSRYASSHGVLYLLHHIPGSQARCLSNQRRRPGYYGPGHLEFAARDALSPDSL